jgi:hypothetical protein
MPDDQVHYMLDRLQKAVDEFEAVAKELEGMLEPFTLGFQQKDLMDNVKLYAIVDYCAAVAKEIGRMANVCEPQLAERITMRMMQEDMDSLEYSGYKYAPDQKTYVNVTNGSKPIVLSWLKTHETGKELVREDFNANALKSWVEKEKEAGHEVHPSISIFEKPTLSRRKLKG